MYIDRQQSFSSAQPVQIEMNFDKCPEDAEISVAKQNRGRRAYLAGQAAELVVDRLYRRKGYEPAAQRWRGGGGEIDLIYRDGAACVFVEVKQSTNFERAVQSLRPAQIQRLMQAASVFVGDEPMGQMTEMRFDVALVNSYGETEILENALWAA
jgi:putative endonuclease